MAKFDSGKDYYEILGVPSTAAQSEIDKQYRQRARSGHPDAGGNEDEMKALNEARDVLTDPETRRAYDADRRADSIPTGSSIVFDHEAAGRAGNLEVPLTGDDFAGLCMNAAILLGLGLPFLFLIEMQWVFFLWPLRFMAFAALAYGVFIANAALRARLRQLEKRSRKLSHAAALVHHCVFWLIVAAGVGAIYFSLYTGRR
ncbi:MAG: hypothetical protein DMF61_12285 [Blastocatellia bacterium AA13]|nr:MAG: hypothetical protein DMF61_12285 [Blastocatellia bacterium AA13]